MNFIWIAVTLPSEGTVRSAEATAFYLRVGKASEDISTASFIFEVPRWRPVLLYTIEHYNLPSRSYNTLEFCANLECALAGRSGNEISSVSYSN